MTDSAVAELCRLTVRAPSVSVDLAVPADVPVADLLPTLGVGLGALLARVLHGERAVGRLQVELQAYDTVL
ncbi:EsaB/YukD family protein, partial [Streptomyces chartreusis]|uniref:EsaB/YukD family protein n=1 Tax=Streptomyces chartreusis TaxID=1969 RepID=UPI003426E448